MYFFEVKKAAKFASWSPTGFKVSINSQPLRLPEDTIFEEVPRNLTKLMNHSSITQTFTRLETKFDMLYERRAFVHWYVLCGQEEGEFGEVKRIHIFLFCFVFEFFTYYVHAFAVDPTGSFCLRGGVA